jgi:hypothetical protein
MQMAAAAAMEQDVDKWEVSAAAAEAAAAEAAAAEAAAAAGQPPQAGLLPAAAGQHFYVQAEVSNSTCCWKRPCERSAQQHIVLDVQHLVIVRQNCTRQCRKRLIAAHIWQLTP